MPRGGLGFQQEPQVIVHILLRPVLTALEDAADLITTVIGIGSGQALGRADTQLGIAGPPHTTVRDVGGPNWSRIN